MRITVKDYEREIRSFNYRLKSKYPYVYNQCAIENHLSMIMLVINNTEYWIQWDNGITVSYWRMATHQENISRGQFFRVVRDANEKLKIYHDLKNTLTIKGDNKCIKI